MVNLRQVGGTLAQELTLLYDRFIEVCMAFYSKQVRAVDGKQKLFGVALVHCPFFPGLDVLPLPPPPVQMA